MDGVPLTLLQGYWCGLVCSILDWVTLTLLFTHSLHNRTNKSVKEWVKIEKDNWTLEPLWQRLSSGSCVNCCGGEICNRKNGGLSVLCRYFTLRTWTWSNYYNWRMCVEWGKQLHRRLTMSVCSTSFSSWSRRRHRSRWVVVAGSKTRLYRKSNRAPPPESLEEVSPRRGGTWLRSYHTQSLVVIAAGCVSTPPAVSYPFIRRVVSGNLLTLHRNFFVVGWPIN